MTKNRFWFLLRSTGILEPKIGFNKTSDKEQLQRSKGENRIVLQRLYIHVNTEKTRGEWIMRPEEKSGGERR